MMYLYLTIVVVVIGILSLIGTLLVGRKVNRTVEEYKKLENRTEEELKRSHEYETKSVRLNVKVLTLIYGFTFLITIIALALYFRFR
ncbi:hypothetical protein [Pseudalkalibacillus sp. SCS-8]|uniref:hypothetical protein n=1 Tax=Pseudalkalibacillus nanhaiensis TaxID=3115291 RepID=UPI0032DB0339